MGCPADGYHGVEEAAHLQEALQRLHHLLLAEGGASGAFPLLQVPDGRLHGQRSTLEDAHSWDHKFGLVSLALVTQETGTATVAKGCS